MSDMSLSKPKTPAVQPAPKPTPVPERSDAETQELAEQQRQRFSGARGRASTFFTGAGLTSSNSASRFLGASSRS